MENQHREIKGYRELNAEEIATMNRVKEAGIALGELVDYLKGNNVEYDQRWVAIGATQLQQGLMALTRAIAKPTFFMFLLLIVAGCVTPYKQPDGKYIKTSQSEMRSMFGTNQSFARLERCDGPEKKVLFYLEGDFKNCEALKPEEQAAWQHGYSRGAGPEIVGAAIVGGSIGAGAALGGGNAAASATAGAANTAIQSITVNPAKPHHR